MRSFRLLPVLLTVCGLAACDLYGESGQGSTGPDGGTVYPDAFVLDGGCNNHDGGCGCGSGSDAGSGYPDAGMYDGGSGSGYPDAAVFDGGLCCGM